MRLSGAQGKFAAVALCALCASARGAYLRGDVNLDGVVDAADQAIIAANMGYRSAVPNPEVILTNVLRVTPDRKTILQGESTGLGAGGGTSTVFWTFIQNGSATGSISVNTSTSVTHTAGLQSSTVDVIQAWDRDNNIGRTYLNVIGSNEVAALGKAIIVAGGRELADPVWIATDYMADKGYGVLRYRGFSRENINYLSFQPGQDVDGDGVLNDIDAATSSNNVAAAFTNWVGNANKLFVYLVDHGSDSAGQGYFRLNSTQTLSAVTLDGWLDQIQNTYTTEVTVVMDYCYAASFLDELAYTGPARRIVLASAAGNEPATFLAGGQVSFSDSFWSGILQGLDLSKSFALARDAMSIYQASQLDDDGSGTFTGADGALSSNVYVGATFVAGKNFPIIGVVLGSQLLTDGTTATLFADDISSYYPIDRVWCTIVPPSYTSDTNSGIPVVDIPEVDLTYDNLLGRHQSSFSGFTENGSYKVSYYARDIWQSVSPPRQSLIIQAGYNDRILIVAGGPTNDAKWPTIRSITKSVYVAAKTRAYTPASIYLISADPFLDADADGTNDVDALSVPTNVYSAVTNWAGTNNTQRLIVYLVGGASNGQFRLSSTDTLSAPALNSALNTLQISNVAVNVIMEFPGAGGYLPQLVPPPGRERINVAACRSTQTPLWSADGLVSFTQYFLSYVFQGETLGNAFRFAQSNIKQASRSLNQRAEIDDTGDGVFSSASDGILAKTRYFGPAFITGDDKPLIGSITPSELIAVSTTKTIWAQDVLDVDGISNVWCVITPPDAASETDLVTLDLGYNAAQSRYEATQTFTKAGTHSLTFYAKDNKGEVSVARQSLLSGPDAYEADDTNTLASFFDIATPQAHTFHTAQDEDWVKFYVVTQYPGSPATLTYNALAEQQGTNVNLKLDLYREEVDGTLTLLDSVDDGGMGDTEYEVVSVYSEATTEGWHYVRISSANTNAWGLDSDYTVNVTVDLAGGRLIVVAVDKLNPTSSPPSAVAVVQGVTNAAFLGKTSVSFPDVPSGIQTVIVTTAAGYVLEEDPQAQGQTTNANNLLYGNPKNKNVIDDSWQSVIFSFVPVGKATGQVRDAFTQVGVSSAKIIFRARNGVISNFFYDGYPFGATYKSNWYTGPDGSFPSNVILPATNWDLILIATNYGTNFTSSVIAGLAPGGGTNLGVRYLTPPDTNGNLIADNWEMLYFGGGIGSTNDPDFDGFDNRTEYLIGTIPTNFQSGLVGDQVNATNGFTLRWPVSAGRVYRVRSSDALTSDLWPLSGGPWTAAVGQAMMTFTDTNTVGMRTYRIEALVP